MGCEVVLLRKVAGLTESWQFLILVKHEMWWIAQNSKSVGGRPRQLPAWVPRQIRTCGTTASGSSSYGFAAQHQINVVHPPHYLPESR